MIYVLLIIACVLAVYFLLRYLFLCRSIRSAGRELQGIVSQIEENQIIKLSEPNSALEELLMTMNSALDAIRQQRVLYERKEKEFRNQIENISHDLRTPLTSILGYLELIGEDAVTVEGWEDLEVVRRKARFLQRLVSQFYDLSRISGGDYPLQMEELDMVRIVKETAADHYQELSGEGRQVEIEVQDKTAYIYGDKDALIRIISNLLENMSKYGKSILRIRIEELDQKVSVLFENDVEDWEGDSAERVFERFYVRDSSRSQGSTGLGLTIARCLAERMGGSLSAGVRTEGESEWLQIRMDFYIGHHLYY